MKEVQDHFFKLAKEEGYRARSAYKLTEIDDRFRLLRPGARVLDLGACPGSWMQVAARRVGERGLVVGIDLKPIERRGLPGHAIAMQGDVHELVRENLPERMEGSLFDAESAQFGVDCVATAMIDHVSVTLRVETELSCLAYVPASLTADLLRFWRLSASGLPQ